MYLHVTFLALVLTAASAASQNSTATGGWIFDTIQPSTELIWRDCLTYFQCALLDVPLDYAKPNGYHAAVPLIKLPAVANSTDGKYKGMILLNPGGPGGSGIELIQSDAFNIRRVTGSNFDLVSFDPRGIGSSLPSANCTPSTAGPITARSGPPPPKVHGPGFLQSLFDDQFAQALTQGAHCQATIGGDDGAGQHMTTTVNARDLISILDAFARGPDAAGLADASALNFWGFSYGTFMAQVFASMFPDRVGRVLLDGVVDPEHAVSGIGTRSVVDTDAVLGTFFVYCHLAGPVLCPYYTGSTAEDIFTRFENSFLQLDPTYALARNWTNATLIESVLELFKQGIFDLTYGPISYFPPLATELVLLEDLLKNGSLGAVLQLSSQLVSNSNEAIWETAVSCTDDGGASFGLTIGQFKHYINRLARQSAIAGELWSTLRIQCAGWSIKGVDRFAGPFGGQTKNPMLFASNTLDPVTPLVNARKSSSKYEGAQLLTVEGQGHTTEASANICAFTKIRAFFQTGELPGKHSHCEQEVGAFNVTLPEPIEKRSDWNAIRERLHNYRKRSVERNLARAT